jgi:hypothetical protein
MGRIVPPPLYSRDKKKQKIRFAFGGRSLSGQDTPDGWDGFGGLNFFLFFSPRWGGFLKVLGVF